MISWIGSYPKQLVERNITCIFWREKLNLKLLERQEIFGATDDKGSGHGVGGPSAFTT